MQPHLTEWRPVIGYEGLYEVSRQAIVRRVHTQRPVAACITGNGYLYVMLWKANKRKNLRLHRIVGLAWLPNPEGLKEFNHKNGNKLDCHVDNLEWSDRSRNLSHARQTGLRVGAGKASKLTPQQARAIRESGQNRKLLAAQFGVSYSLVSLIKQGNRWPYA